MNASLIIPNGYIAKDKLTRRQTIVNKYTLEKTEWGIRNGQYRVTGNIGYTGHRTKTNNAKKTLHRKLRR
jgi:hypothetical protein